MKSKFLTISVVVLALFSIFTYMQSVGHREDIKKLASVVESKTNKVVVYEGKDGYTPVKGIDYFDGSNGINAMSYSITQTVIKEVPLIGTPGKSAYDIWLEAGNVGTIEDFINSLKVKQVSRVNPDTKDVETRYSDERGWTVLYTCSEYRLECPEV